MSPKRRFIDIFPRRVDRIDAIDWPGPEAEFESTWDISQGITNDGDWRHP